MRSLIFIILMLPFAGLAQVNRSAKELASEKVQEYVKQKLFKKRDYKSVSFGEIKSIGDNKSELAWALVHSFEIRSPKDPFTGSGPSTKTYKFMFYMDQQMNVRRAETYYVE